MSECCGRLRNDGMFRCRGNGIQKGITYLITKSRELSGKEQSLLTTPPVRTVRASFPAHGSSLRKLIVQAGYATNGCFAFAIRTCMPLTIRSTGRGRTQTP